MCDIISSVLILLSYVLLITMLSIVLQLTSNDKKFQIVYLCSKLLTIKNIVGSNHNLKIINDFSPSGEPIGLNVGYRILLKLINNNGCQENYRSCGILDTIGNVLCIDDILDCPINKMKVDSNEKTELYLNSNYSTTILRNTSPNYSFFYSKDFKNGKAKVSIIKTAEVEPKYVTLENFIIDYETYKYLFNNLQKNEESSTLFGNDGVAEVSETLIKIIELFLEDVNEIVLELITLGAKGFLYLIKLLSKDNKKRYIQQFEKFKKYLEKRIDEDEEKSIDEYYTHIGDYFYAETYIGFKSIKDLDTFMKFDRTILSKAFFPNIGLTVVPLVFVSFFFAICVIGIFYILVEGKENVVHEFNMFQSFFLNIIALGYFIYSTIKYKKIHNNKKLEQFKLIQSDGFINDFIKDFVGECKNYELKIRIIISFSIVASALNIITSIISFLIE